MVTLNFVNFLAHDDGIVLANFISPQLTIVKTAIVLVAVAMSRTKEASTTTFKTCCTHN